MESKPILTAFVALAFIETVIAVSDESLRMKILQGLFLQWGPVFLCLVRSHFCNLDDLNFLLGTIESR